MNSDVGLALTEEFVQVLKSDYKNIWTWINNACTDHYATEKNGQLFIFENIDWDYNRYIMDLYSTLEDFKADFKLVGVRHDEPNFKWQRGNWDNNPFELCRKVILHYERQDTNSSISSQILRQKIVASAKNHFS